MKNLANIQTHPKFLEIKIPDKIKILNKKVAQPILILPYFKERPGICVASTSITYLEKTKDYRPHTDDTLLITYKKPFHPASTQAISRWIKTTSGIDINKYTAHSTK